MGIDKNVDVYSKYKEISDKYFEEDENGALISGLLIMNYIFKYGNDIDKFEEYVKKYKKMQEEMRNINE